MRFLSIVVLGLLVGCSGAPESIAVDTQTAVSPGIDPGGEIPKRTEPSTMCGMVQVIRTFTDAGEVDTFFTLPCNPSWQDPSDPAPDHKNIVDPAPEKFVK